MIGIALPGWQERRTTVSEDSNLHNQLRFDMILSSQVETFSHPDLIALFPVYSKGCSRKFKGCLGLEVTLH